MSNQPPVDSADLAVYDDDYAAADVQPNQFDEVPDGKYQIKVEKVELVRTQNGAPMLKWHLRVLGPQHRGRMMFRNNVMSSSETIKFLKADLLACGLELGKLSDLPSRLGELLDVALEVTKKTRGEYANVYLNKRIVLDDPMRTTRARPKARCRHFKHGSNFHHRRHPRAGSLRLRFPAGGAPGAACRGLLGRGIRIAYRGRAKDA
jgi:hypothetical protein